MNQYEQQKALQRKRAQFSFLTLILGLSTPTLFSVSKQANLPLTIQVALYCTLLIALFACLFQKKQIKIRLEQMNSYSDDLHSQEQTQFKKSS